MTIDQLWQNTLQYGALFLLFVGVILFYAGKLVSGDLATRARESEVTSMQQSHKESMQALKDRYDEMQSTWRERYLEVVRDRDYFRALAGQLAKQSQQAISVQESVAMGQAPFSSPLDSR